MSIRRRAVSTRLANELRQEREHHATTRGLFDARGKGLEVADRLIAELRNDLTAAQLERDTARRDVSRLNMRCEAMGRMLYPHDDPAREAVEGDIGWPTEHPSGNR